VPLVALAPVLDDLFAPGVWVGFVQLLLQELLCAPGKLPEFLQRSLYAFDV
jgi:hypothetical protein